MLLYCLLLHCPVLPGLTCIICSSYIATRPLLLLPSSLWFYYLLFFFTFLTSFAPLTLPWVSCFYCLLLRWSVLPRLPYGTFVAPLTLPSVSIFYCRFLHCPVLPHIHCHLCSSSIAMRTLILFPFPALPHFPWFPLQPSQESLVSLSSPALSCLESLPLTLQPLPRLASPAMHASHRFSCHFLPRLTCLPPNPQIICI